MLQLTVLPLSQIQIQGSIRRTTYHPSENSESRLWALQEGDTFCRITNFNNSGQSHSSKLSHLLASHKVNFYSDTKAHYRATTKMDRSWPLTSNLRRKSYGIKELQTRPFPFVQNKQNPSRADSIYFRPVSLLQNMQIQLEKSPFVFSYSLLRSGASLLKLLLINTKAKTFCLYTIKFTAIFRDTNLDSSFHWGDC